MYRILLAAFAAFFMSACATTGMEVHTTPKNVEVKKLTKVSDKTIRYVSKMEIGKFLCEQQSFRHTEQRVIAEVGETKIYSQIWAPFDMPACLNAMTKTPWERLASQFMSDVGAPLVKLGAKYGIRYAIADKTIDYLKNQNDTIAGAAQTAAENAAPRVEGDNNRVIVGDGNEYTEAGGIATSELDLADGQFTISNVPPEEEVDEEACIDLDEDGFVDGQTGSLTVEDCLAQ